MSLQDKIEALYKDRANNSWSSGYNAAMEDVLALLALEDAHRRTNTSTPYPHVNMSHS